MNIFTIFAGLAILAIATFTGFVSVGLFMQGGITPIFGGVAMAIIGLMSLVLGIVLIGIGCAGIVERIRKGAA